MGEGRVGVLKARSIIAQSVALGENKKSVLIFISPPYRAFTYLLSSRPMATP